MIKPEKNESLPFVDFYASHGIIPTRQDITDLPRHVDRRISLYRNLGLPSAMLKGSSVLEFGPGSGHNALVTALLRPSRYLLVDANPASLSSTQELLAQSAAGVPVELCKSAILDFQTDERFDLVLCEGVIPTQLDPSAFLRHVASFTTLGGVVVFTCMDAISLLPEMLRRYVAWQLTHDMASFEQKVAYLSSFFAPDLANLPGMSRHAEDWVIDQIIHPWGGPLFSIPEAVEALSAQFAVLGSSPRFLLDWRWYKDVHGTASGDNSFAVKSYELLAHNLIDYRSVSPEQLPHIFSELESLCVKIHARVFAQETSVLTYSPEEIADDVMKLSELAANWSSDTSESLCDFSTTLLTKTNKRPHFNKFTKLWGRGQQYISMVKLHQNQDGCS